MITLPLRRPKGPWRANKSVAVADALAAGLAHRDGDDPGRLAWDPRAEIEERESSHSEPVDAPGA